MSEPQHPQTQGTQTNGGQSGSVAGDVQTVPASFESFAAAGARLVLLREAKGWSIDDVSARLKVPPSKMRALEAGDISHLPGTTFALGVVRSYAKMLGVDPVPFAQALRREKGEPEPDLSMPASTGADLPRRRVSVSLGGTSRHRSWWWGVGAVVIALIALVMWHGSGESPAWLARWKSSANGAASNAGDPASSVVRGTTFASDAEVAQPGDAATANPGTPAAGGASAVDQARASEPAAALTPVPRAIEPGAARTASAPLMARAVSTAPAVDVASGASAPAGEHSIVTLKVTQDSWFSVRDKSGKEVFSGVVRAGDKKDVAGEQPFKIVAGNQAGVDSISLDGKTVEAGKYSAGKGNVSRFTLP